MANNFNNILPYELLKLVFRYLKEESFSPEEEAKEKQGIKDLKTCLLVCKSWQLVAREFFDSEISIALTNESSLESLLEDISYFGSKVKYITLTRSTDKWPEEYQIRFSLFHKILIACSSLESVTFMNKNNNYEYLNRIAYSTKKLPRVKNFDVYGLDEWDEYTRQLYLYVNLQHHENIRQLTVASSKDLSSFDDFDDLIQLIAYFPNLTCFELMKVSSIPNDTNIDIHQLFKVAPQLVDVKFSGLKEINCNSLEEESSEVLGNTFHLENLSITTEVMDIKSLKYITRGLKTYNYLLSLHIETLVTDALLSENDMIQLQNDLKVWSNGKDFININYSYDGVSYHVDNQ